MNWKLVPFKSLYAEPSRNGIYKKKEFHGTGTRIVNMKEIFAFPFLHEQEMNLLSLTKSELSKFKLEEGDLLFARRSLIEEGAGKCVLVTKHDEPMVFESSIIRVRLNKSFCHPPFYYYYFSSPTGRNIIKSIVTGVAQKGIRGSELQNLKVHNPKFQTQEKIAEYLGSYDDLIANNGRRITLLEEAMHLLYREWFVHLRFPGWEETAVVDGVPEGWKRIAVGKVLQKLNRKPRIKKRDYLEIGEFPAIDQGSDFIGGYTNEKESVFDSPLPVVVFGDHTSTTTRL